MYINVCLCRSPIYLTHILKCAFHHFNKFCLLFAVMQDSLFPGVSFKNSRSHGDISHVTRSHHGGSTGSLRLIQDGQSRHTTHSPSGNSPTNHQQYLRELERIRTEIAGFQPIEAIESPPARSSKSWSLKPQVHDDNVLDGDDYY